jgi:two-component system phosphate regulon sensor histidine kinase PhoR
VPGGVARQIFLAIFVAGVFCAASALLWVSSGSSVDSPFWAPLLASVGLAALAAWFGARRVTGSITSALEKPVAVIEGLGQRDFSSSSSLAGVPEFSGLYSAVSKSSAELATLFDDLTRQHSEGAAVLASMSEGVVAVDGDGVVIALNRVARELLGLGIELRVGRSIEELTRLPQLQELVRRALAGEQCEDEVLTLWEAQSRSIQARGAMVEDPRGQRLGAVVVLNDVTELRRLEAVRRDFVANVSHELRTPITSIKGFLETLEDGAIDDAEQARRFVGIAARQADRLGSIVEDLLVLSRLEETNSDLELETESVHRVLLAAVELCASKAAAKRIEVAVQCDPDLVGSMNAPLLEQAVSNLLINAINYSEADTVVSIAAQSQDGGVTIALSDQGPGIEERHLPRLFERFYRVDKARSRGAGGTGLGLAIVKHIAQVHGGGVKVRSRPGQGSTFTLYLGIPVESGPA